MELHSLGKFRLVAPFPVRSALCRFYLAREESDLEETPPTYLAKLLLPSTGAYATTLSAQFEHEISLMQAFNHHSIPSVHAAGNQDGVAYLVMDRVDGVDLAHFLGHTTDTPRAVSKEVAVYIMGQLADALRHVHDLEQVGEGKKPEPVEVIHRDICPGNVLLSTEGDVLLTDFGAASSRWLDPEHDMAQAGHKAYMAPERVSGSGSATQKTDLFAMAVILWEMLRGERCFGGEDGFKVMDEIVRFDIGQSSRRVSGLSPKLGDILRKNLDRDPGRRYTGAFQMLQRLAQAPEAQAAEQSRLELAAMVSELNASAHAEE